MPHPQDPGSRVLQLCPPPAISSYGNLNLLFGELFAHARGPCVCAVCAADCVVKAAVDGGLGFFHVLVIKQPLHLLPIAWNKLLYGKPIIYRHWSLPLLFQGLFPEPYKNIMLDFERNMNV